jgi:hypothetical protein
MWFFSNHVPTGLVNYWWQQMTFCQLLTVHWVMCSLLGYIVCYFHNVYGHLKSSAISLHIYPCKNKVVEKFSEYSLCIFHTKMRLWSILVHFIAEGITKNVLTFTLKFLVWCVTMRLAVTVSGKPLLVL